MSKSSKILLLLGGWFLTISALHVWLNVGFDKLAGGSAGVKRKKFMVGFLPVT